MLTFKTIFGELVKLRKIIKYQNIKIGAENNGHDKNESLIKTSKNCKLCEINKKQCQTHGAQSTYVANGNVCDFSFENIR